MILDQGPVILDQGQVILDRTVLVGGTRSSSPTPSHWWVGDTHGRALYFGEKLVGFMDTAKGAERVTWTLNQGLYPQGWNLYQMVAVANRLPVAEKSQMMAMISQMMRIFNGPEGRECEPLHERY